MINNPLSNIKTIFDFGRSQEKIIFQQLKRLLKETKTEIEYTNKKSEKRLPHDFEVRKNNKSVYIDVETTPNTSPWSIKWDEKGTVEEVLNRGLRMPLRKFDKQIGDVHLYLKFSPSRKHFFCFVFPEVSKHLVDGEKDRMNKASHVKPNNNFFKVMPWSEVNNLKNCVIFDDFPALKQKILELLK